MDAQLIPPIGTCYFKSYTVPLWETGIFALNVTFYVYVTNVKPTDPDFIAKGGKIYIVVVSDGSVLKSSEKTTNIHHSLTNLTDDPSLLSCTQQLPILGSGVKEGDYTFYKIDFAQTMNMYNNDGNSAFQFPARYRKDFSLYKFEQEPFRYPPEFWGFNLIPLERDRGFEEPTVNNIQVFEANRLTVAKLEPRANDLIYDLDFSADAMTRAVVGG